MVGLTPDNQAISRGLDPADCSKLRFACGHCGAEYRVSLRIVGKLVRCRHCGKPCQVPRSTPQVTSDRPNALKLPPRVGHTHYLDILESHAAPQAEPPVVSESVLPRSRPDRLLIAANIAALVVTVLVIAGLLR